MWWDRRFEVFGPNAELSLYRVQFCECESGEALKVVVYDAEQFEVAIKNMIEVKCSSQNGGPTTPHSIVLSASCSITASYLC